MADSSVPRTKRCTGCGGDYLLDFFRRDTSTTGSYNSKPEAQRHRDRCIGCEAVGKRSELIDQRLRRKAISTRRRHGAKLKDLGVIKDEGDLGEVYGWSLDQMVGDIERVKDRGCPYCLQPVNIAEQGLGMITLDILALRS